MGQVKVKFCIRISLTQHEHGLLSINTNCHLYMERDGYEEDEKVKSEEEVGFRDYAVEF